MKQAWCTNPKCDGGAKVGPDCPAAFLQCCVCGSKLSFDGPTLDFIVRDLRRVSTSAQPGTK